MPTPLSPSCARDQTSTISLSFSAVVREFQPRTPSTTSVFSLAPSSSAFASATIVVFGIGTSLGIVTLV
ncbi:hypothetical protein V6N13_076242 [Hibiscus sabdariffa]